MRRILVVAALVPALVLTAAPASQADLAEQTGRARSAVAAASVPTVTGPSKATVATRFVLALKQKRYAVARRYVSGQGPGGVAAVVRRPWNNQTAAWARVTGASCDGYLCFARNFPATPAPAWYVVVRGGRWRVVARAYLAAADYVQFTGNRGCLRKDVKVRNRSGAGYNVILTAEAGSPVRWTAKTQELINVAIDVGWTTPKANMVYGYVPNPGSLVGPCGE